MSKNFNRNTRDMLEFRNVQVAFLRESVVASGNSMRTEPAECTDAEFEHGLERCRKLVKHGTGSGHTNFRTGIRVCFEMKYTQYITKQFQRYHWFDYVNSSSLMHRITRMDFSKCVNKYVSNTSKRQMICLVDVYNRMASSAGDPEAYASVIGEYRAWVGGEYGDGVFEGIGNDHLYDCYMRIVSNCPMGTELFVMVNTNYEQLATICKQRKGHRLKEDYKAFFDFVKSLPYAHDLILTE